MPDNSELLKQFQTVFGEKGGDVLPGNVGESRTVLPVCHEIMKLPEPFLFDYFVAWETRVAEQRQPWHIERHLLEVGQLEGAWALAQLHYDQLLKQEISANKRVHKGHPLCNLAIVARAVESSTLIHHYAQLSSAGDIYWEHEEPHLRQGGYAPTMLEQFESHHQQQAWRAKVRTDLQAHSTATPLYLESFLASRWFSDAYSQHFTNLADMKSHGGRPFVEVLLRAVEDAPKGKDTTTGARFEAAAGLLLSSTPGFEVDSGRKTTDEQVDLVVVYTPERLAQLGLEPGCGLVECKSSAGRVDVSELRDFGAKCIFHRVKFGILVARSGVTGAKAKTRDLFNDLQYAELTRRRFQVDGLTLLVLDISHLREKSRELRGLLDELRADYRELVFGPVP